MNDDMITDQNPETILSILGERFDQQERQKRIIAERLHSCVSQNLAVAKFKISELSDLPGAIDCKPKIEGILNLFDQAIDDIREIEAGLVPPLLYLTGVESAIGWLVDKLDAESVYQAEFVDDGLPKPLSDSKRVLLFRVVEQLLESVKAGSISRDMRIKTGRDENDIIISIILDSADSQDSESSGKIKRSIESVLLLFSRKITESKGRIKLVSRPEGGMEITLICPLDI